MIEKHDTISYLLADGASFDNLLTDIKSHKIQNPKSKILLYNLSFTHRQQKRCRPTKQFH